MEALRYIDKNIGEINALGVAVEIEKISKDEFDEELVESFRKKGITRLPVLLAPDGAPFIGVKNVIGLFEKNLGTARMGGRIGAAKGGYDGGVNAEMGSNADMNDFWMDELFAGKDRKGKMIARTDKDECEDESKDFDKKMSDYKRNMPKHHRKDTDETNIDTPRRRREVPTEDYDNVVSSDEDSYEEPRSRKRMPEMRLPSSGEGGDGDAMDNKMLAAWMENN